MCPQVIDLFNRIDTHKYEQLLSSRYTEHCVKFLLSGHIEENAEDSVFHGLSIKGQLRVRLPLGVLSVFNLLCTYNVQVQGRDPI